MRLLIVLILSVNFCYGQTYNSTELYNASHKLNGGMRSQFGGMSRLSIPLILPAKSIKLVYSISTSTDAEPNPIYLASQVAEYLLAAPGLSSLAGMITGTTQQSLISVYAYNNKQCSNYFVNKQNSNCYTMFKHENVTGGTFADLVPKLNFEQIYFLGLRNPSEVSATYFHIEVVAITEN